MTAELTRVAPVTAGAAGSQARRAEPVSEPGNGAAPAWPGPPGRAQPPLASPLADPCAERHQISVSGDDSRLDVFLSGIVFMDVIFTGLPGAPIDGTEIYSRGLGSAPGGCANLAVALSRLGLNVGLGAGFGNDMFGEYLWRTLAEQEGIDLSASRRLPGWPTPVTVSLSHGDDRSMITYREPLPDGSRDELVSGPVPPAATCFVGLHRDMPSWLYELRESGAIVFADVGWDGTGEWAAAVLDRLDLIDVFLPNSVEAMAYTRTSSPRAALQALSSRVPLCVVKDGGRGAIACDAATGEMARAPAIPVEVLDPTGAGDVFDAGFIFGTLAGWPLAQRLKFANLCAGLSVRHRSGSLGAPCWGEIAEWGENPDVPPGILAEYGFVVPYIPDAAVDNVVRASPTVGYGA
jgi:sugar/nucleoside kinase (ribokinase family)